MSYFVLLWIVLSFCHPTLLAVGVFIIIMVILFNYCPIVFWLVLSGLIGLVVWMVILYVKRKSSRQKGKSISYGDCKIKVDNKKQSYRRYKERQTITDYDSVCCVFNILPDEFEQGVVNNLFDKTLLHSVNGGIYEVPLYYVTKAWDILLKGPLFPVDYMIGPEEEEGCTDEDIREFLEEERAIRSRNGACRDNDKMKQLWKELFDIDIDSLSIDFSQYNMHLPPNVNDREYLGYFFRAIGGVNKWILWRINHPDDKHVSHDYVSALMEFTAQVLLWRKGEVCPKYF